MPKIRKDNWPAVRELVQHFEGGDGWPIGAKKAEADLARKLKWLKVSKYDYGDGRKWRIEYVGPIDTETLLRYYKDEAAAWKRLHEELIEKMEAFCQTL